MNLKNILRTSLLVFLSLYIHSLFGQRLVPSTHPVSSAIAIGSDCFQITDTTVNKGAVWSDSQINLNNPFDLTFDVIQRSNPPGGGPTFVADGIAFVLQNDPAGIGALGTGGLNLGYMGTASSNRIEPSIGIELDIWGSDTSQMDDLPPPGNEDHLAVHINGIKKPALFGPFNLQPVHGQIPTGVCRNFRIKWIPSVDSLYVWYDGTQWLAEEYDMITNIFGGDPMVYFGFTGSCGGTDGEQFVCYRFADAGADTAVCFPNPITLTGAGGENTIRPDAVPPSYSWDDEFSLGGLFLSNPNIPNPVFNPLILSPPYTYYLTVTNSYGCTDIDTLVIGADEFTASATGMDVDICVGMSSSITANPAVSGTGIWNSLDGATVDFPSTPTSTVSGLVTAPLAYEFEWLLDNGACPESRDTMTINLWPAPLSDAGPDLSLCLSETLTIEGNAGAGMTASWSPGLTLGTPGNDTTTATPTSTTVYTLTATEPNSGCVDTDDVTVVVNALPTAASPSVIDAGCTIANGSATASASGGTGPYTYLWSDGQTTATASSLTAGSYDVTVSDVNGCQDFASTTIGTTSSPSASIPSFTDAGCTVANGTATASGSGGTGALSYLWSDGQTTATATGLAAGPYGVTVTDVNGCTALASITISTVPGPTASIPSFTDAGCTVSNGTANASGTGGTGAYTYLWSSGQTTANITGLAPGVYTVTLTDVNGCFSTASTTIGTLGGPTSSIPSFTDAGCTTAIGTATSSITGGTMPYAYLWSDGQTTATATSLATGFYNLTVTDGAGCSHVSSVTIGTLAGPTVSIPSFTDAGCTADIGTATAAASGGVAPYSYVWNNGQTSVTATGLTAGLYLVSVTDANGCEETSSVTIGTLAGPTASIASSSNANCGNSDGTVTAAATGGTGGYHYVWSTDPLDTLSTLTGLPGGTYAVTITDDGGCTDVTSVSIISTPSVNLSVSAATMLTCHGDTNGTATASAAGGDGAYSYSWETIPPQSGMTATGLEAGVYAVIVTDGGGCTDTTIATISEPAPLDISIAVTSTGPATSDAAATVTGGSPGYTYVWSDGQTTATAVGLSTGFYSVTVTDINGCSSVKNVVITGVIITSTSGNWEPGIFNVYPNPTHDQFTLEFTRFPDGPITTRLVNPLGQIVWQSLPASINRLKTQHSVAEVASGLYFLEVIGEEGQGVVKMLIER